MCCEDGTCYRCQETKIVNSLFPKCKHDKQWYKRCKDCENDYINSSCKHGRSLASYCSLCQLIAMFDSMED